MINDSMVVFLAETFIVDFEILNDYFIELCLEQK